MYFKYGVILRAETADTSSFFYKKGASNILALWPTSDFLPQKFSKNYNVKTHSFQMQ